jgi:hypothetical protein
VHGDGAAPPEQAAVVAHSDDNPTQKIGPRLCREVLYPLLCYICGERWNHAARVLHLAIRKLDKSWAICRVFVMDS